eukprot:6138933-Prymnesium_polylepis.1
MMQPIGVKIGGETFRWTTTPLTVAIAYEGSNSSSNISSGSTFSCEDIGRWARAFALQVWKYSHTCPVSCGMYRTAPPYAYHVLAYKIVCDLRA